MGLNISPEFPGIRKCCELLYEDSLFHSQRASIWCQLVIHGTLAGGCFKTWICQSQTLITIPHSPSITSIIIIILLIIVQSLFSVLSQSRLIWLRIVCAKGWFWWWWWWWCNFFAHQSFGIKVVGCKLSQLYFIKVQFLLNWKKSFQKNL